METKKTALIVGASRGLGLALAKEFVARGWRVIGTVRETSHSKLHALQKGSSGNLQIEHVDITVPVQVERLERCLSVKSLDLLFINAGVANAGGMSETIADISTDEFVRVMLTNTLSPMRVAEQLKNCVVAGGIIGVMSSGQGSVADNEKGGNDVYRASKAALNMVMRSFAARYGKDYSLLLLAPGWVSTDMGGAKAPFSIEEVVPQLVDTLVAQEGKRGLQYLDRFGKPVRW